MPLVVVLIMRLGVVLRQLVQLPFGALLALVHCFVVALLLVVQLVLPLI